LARNARERALDAGVACGIHFCQRPVRNEIEAREIKMKQQWVTIALHGSQELADKFKVAVSEFSQRWAIDEKVKISFPPSASDWLASIQEDDDLRVAVDNQEITDGPPNDPQPSTH
jgi:hypothetical protein